MSPRAYPQMQPCPPLDCAPRGVDGRTGPEPVAAIVPRVLDAIVTRCAERRVRAAAGLPLCDECDCGCGQPAAAGDTHAAPCRAELEALYADVGEVAL